MLNVLSGAKGGGATVLARSSIHPEWYPVRVGSFWVFRVTRELIDDFDVLEVRGYVAAYDDFDTNCCVYARREIAWAARAWFAWRKSRWRYCIEHALNRRIIDKPIGHAWTAWTWRVRPPWYWTYRRTPLQPLR